MIQSIINQFNSLFEAFPYVLDGIRVAIFGLLIEVARRYAFRGFAALQKGLTVSVSVRSDDEVYGWIDSWLAEQIQTSTVVATAKDGEICKEVVNPAKQVVKSDPKLWDIIVDSMWPTGKVPPRHLNITNTPFSTSAHKYAFERKSDVAPDKHDELGRPTLHASLMVGSTMTIKFQGKTLKLEIADGPYAGPKRTQWIHISCFLGKPQLLDDFIAMAYQTHKNRDKGKLRIFSPAGESRKGGEHWTLQAAKSLRPWESVILPKGVKENLLADCQEFLNDPAFYEERGIPYRRGYLLYGVPGAGKSSIMAALASKLGLDIYMLQIGDQNLDDSALSNLLAACPRRSMLLLEDVDCAMPTRQPAKAEGDENEDEVVLVAEDGDADDATDKGDAKDDDADDDDKKKPKKGGNGPAKSKVTLAGLLNALDGVASSEGRLTFFTTNHPERIDPAMSRPGQCDVWLEFTSATQDQARDLFLRFNSTFATSSRTDRSLTLDEKADGRLAALADQFAEAIPEGKVSVSALQAYLLRYKRDAEGAAAEVMAWVEGGCKQESLTSK